MDRCSQWQAAEMARVRMKGPLVVFLQVLELHEHFQLVYTTFLKENLGGRNLGQTFELQIAMLVRLRHAIPKRIFPGDG